MNQLIVVTGNINFSLARFLLSTSQGYQEKSLIRESTIKKLFEDNQPAHVILNNLINRPWSLPAKQPSNKLSQYYHYHKKGTSTISTLLIIYTTNGNRFIELRETDLTQAKEVAYLKVFADDAYWYHVYTLVTAVQPNFFNVENSHLLGPAEHEDTTICAPVMVHTPVKNIKETDYVPRYNRLLDATHLATSDGQLEMIDVVTRLTTGVNWLERAFTDRPYYHREVVSGNHHTEIEMILFPDRTKLVIVKRMYYYRHEEPQHVWVGVSKYNSTAREYLNKVGLTYDFRGSVFVATSKHI